MPPDFTDGPFHPCALDADDPRRDHANVMIPSQKLSLFVVVAAIGPFVTRSAPLVPVSETRHSHVQGSVELYDSSQLPDDIVIVASDSFYDSYSGSAYASEGFRYGSISAEAWAQRTLSSDRIELKLENSISYSRDGHFMDLQGDSFNEYQLTFELTQPSKVQLTGFLSSYGPGSISTDAEIQLAGWHVSLARDGDSLTFDTTMQLDAGRYTFSASSSAEVPYSDCCSEDEYGYTQLEVLAVFTPVPEPVPRALGAALTLAAFLHGRRRMRTQV